MLKCKRVFQFAVAIALIAWVSVAHRDANSRVRAQSSFSTAFAVRSSLFDYYDYAGCFPPAVSQVDGRIYSWRLLVEDFIQKRNGGSSLDFSKPWDSEVNATMLSRSEAGFSRPTNDIAFMAVTGDQTAFPPRGKVTKQDVRDGAENTVVIMEVRGSDHWAKPGDIRFEELRSIYDGTHSYSLDSHCLGVCLIFADGAWCGILNKPPFEAFESLFTISGGEPWTRADLIRAGYLIDGDVASSRLSKMEDVRK